MIAALAIRLRENATFEAAVAAQLEIDTASERLRAILAGQQEAFALAVRHEAAERRMEEILRNVGE